MLAQLIDISPSSYLYPREGYKAKCSQYWPDEVGDEMQTEELTVTMKFVRDDVLYVTRSFLVMNKETEQSVSFFPFIY
jgi:hypothetical protein